MFRALSVVFAVLFAPSAALAHFVWIVPSCEEERCSAELYFGEYAAGPRETKSTRLPERAGLETELLSSDREAQALSLELREESFHAEFERPKNGAVLAIDDEGEVVDWRKHRLGIVRPIFYARAIVPGSSGNAPDAPKKYALDLLPLDVAAGVIKVGAPAKFRVLFNGEPYTGRAELRVYAPNGWSWEGSLSKADSTVSFTPLWPGLYVAEAIVREERSGTFKGKEYEAIRHRATLSLRAEE